MYNKIFVTYNGKEYTNGLDPLVRKLTNNYCSVTINSEEGKENYDVSKICKFEETEEELILTINTLNFNTNLLSFNEEYFASYKFNKKTGEGFSDYPDIKPIKLIPSCFDDMMNYIAKVASFNKVVYQFLEENTSLTRRFTRQYNFEFFEVLEQNLFNFITNNLIEMEKLITSGNDKYLLDLLKTPNAKLEKGKKLSQVVSLPKFALDFINEYDLLQAKTYIQNIANEFDGNTLKIIIEMMESFVIYDKEKKTRNYWNSPATRRCKFLENIYTLLKNNYKIVDLLNYLLKQRMYWSDSNFGFPYEEAKLLCDYISICEKHSLKCEKYPQNLVKYHDIVVKNIAILESDKEKKEKFEEAVSKYYNEDIEIEDYIFTAPKSIADLVFEGDSLHHCIGNYSDAIINGISRIYFMRKKAEPKKPYVTVELNCYNDLIEFKEDYNKEPTEVEVKKAIKDFVKEVKKTGGK